MPPELNPEHLREWNPYVLLVFLGLLLPMLGGAVAWVLTGGMERYKIWREFKAKERKEQAKEKADAFELKRKQDESKKLIDRLLETKNTDEGWKSLLLMYDARMQELELRDTNRGIEMQKMHDAYHDCLEKHSAASARNQRLEDDLKYTNDRCQVIEEKCESMRKRLIELSPQNPEKWPLPLPPKKET